VWEVAVYFMGDSASAKKLEDYFKELAKQQEQIYNQLIEQIESGNFDPTIQMPKRYIVYRYDDVVVFGDWESVTIVRSY
jgi:hypothetical protein